MRVMQMVLCILACLCIVAAVVVGAFLQNLVAVICLILGAVICGAGMFFLKSQANAKEEREARRNRPDFMNPPKETRDNTHSDCDADDRD